MSLATDTLSLLRLFVDDGDGGAERNVPGVQCR